MNNFDTLHRWILDSKKTVFFGGAGVSTESGIPDFRSVDGLFHQQFAYPPEVMISHRFFLNHTAEFYRFYLEKMIFPQAVPNAAHQALALLEAKGLLSSVITQNIDGLHQAAGSKHVLELHGSVHRNYCLHCRKFYGLTDILSKEAVPTCTCGGIIKPDVVLYEEPLDQRIMEQAIKEIGKADLLIIGGTSLNVYPAAGMIDLFHGKHLVIINKSPTPQDQRADLCIAAPIGETLRPLLTLVN